MDRCKFYKQQKQVSYDYGLTWSNVSPAEYRKGDIFESGSTDCGYIPPTPTFDEKWLATYADSHTESAQCGSYSGIVQYEINGTNIVSVEIGDCVTSIDNCAFYDFSAMTSCTIGSNVTSIGNSAFSGCKSLTDITIPSGVTSISNNTFYNCISLSSVTIPNSVTSIGNSAFKDCSGLTNVTIGSGVTSIGEWAFDYCSSLTSLTIPDNVTSIGKIAFSRCGYTTLIIGSGVTSIGQQSFSQCSNLTSITMSNSITSISDYAFSDNANLKRLNSNTDGVANIPSGVTSIGEGSFINCYSLTSITIPNSVTSIGQYAFNICSGLTSITIEATTPPALGTYAFRYTNDAPIYVPAQSVNAYKTASGWSTYSSRITAIQ